MEIKADEITKIIREQIEEYRGGVDVAEDALDRLHPRARFRQRDHCGIAVGVTWTGLGVL